MVQFTFSSSCPRHGHPNYFYSHKCLWTCTWQIHTAMEEGFIEEISLHWTYRIGPLEIGNVRKEWQEQSRCLSRREKEAGLPPLVLLLKPNYLTSSGHLRIKGNLPWKHLQHFFKGFKTQIHWKIVFSHNPTSYFSVHVVVEIGRQYMLNTTHMYFKISLSYICMDHIPYSYPNYLNTFPHALCYRRHDLYSYFKMVRCNMAWYTCTHLKDSNQRKGLWEDTCLYACVLVSIQISWRTGLIYQQPGCSVALSLIFSYCPDKCDYCSSPGLTRVTANILVSSQDLKVYRVLKKKFDQKRIKKEKKLTKRA
jgi:hypothetical protein